MTGFLVRRCFSPGEAAAGGILFFVLPVLVLAGLLLLILWTGLAGGRARGAFLGGAVLVCLLWGAAAGERLARQESAVSRGILGQPLAAVEGTAAADSRRNGRGQLVTAVGVDRVETGGVCSAEGSAQFPLMVTLTDGTALRRGQRVRIDLAGSLAPGEGGRGGTAWAAAKTDGVDLLGWNSRPSEVRAGVLRWAAVPLGKLKPGTAGLAEALLWGDKNRLPHAWQEAFRRAGCAHLLALSGMHVGVLVSLAGLLLGRLWGRRRADRAGALLLAGYPFLSGMQPSLIRAVGFFGLRAWAEPLRRCSPTVPLTLVLLVQMMVFPESPGRLSFQLSYGALFAILLATPAITLRLEKYLPPLLAAPLAASIAAQGGTLPVLLLTIGEVHPVGIAASLVLTPLVILFMALLLGYLLVCLLGSAPLLPAGFSPAAGFGILPGVPAGMPARFLDALAELLARTASLPAEVPGLNGPAAWGLAAGLLLAGASLPAGEFLRASCGRGGRCGRRSEYGKDKL